MRIGKLDEMTEMFSFSILTNVPESLFSVFICNSQKYTGNSPDSSPNRVSLLNRPKGANRKTIHTTSINQSINKLYLSSNLQCSTV